MPGMERVPLDREPYPEAVDAVRLHEEHYCQELFDEFRCRGYCLGRAMKYLIAAADQTLPLLRAGSVSHARMVNVRKEMYTEDFRRYVAGKLGML
jgi:hypothetical protein